MTKRRLHIPKIMQSVADMHRTVEDCKASVPLDHRTLERLLSGTLTVSDCVAVYKPDAQLLAVCSRSQVVSMWTQR